MTAPQPHTASLPCGKVFYTKSGSGPDMILLHGWGCDNTTLESVRRTAALTHTVYNLDFPGFGSSPEPEGIWSVFDYADMLGQFIAATGIKRPVLLGHSFGGRVSIIYASAHHDVDKVVLVDSAGVRNPLPLRKRLKVAAFKAAKKIAPVILGKTKGAEFIDRWRGSAGSADYRAASPKMRAIMSKVIAQDLRHLMPEIKAPTLLIWGEHDDATPLADAHKMEALIPGSGLVVLPGDHYSFLRSPAQFAAVLSSFLAS